MIDEIQVEDVALIRSASMTPSAHLTVLTGETGAGKTALLSAAKLLMGARADKGAVREGSAAARVSGRFYLRASLAGGAPDGLASSADIRGASRGAAAGAASPATPAGYAGSDARGEADGAEAGDDLELVVTRRLSADGRSRVTLNGAMASVTELAERVGPSIDLCGQHEHQALMASSSHGRLLDAWGGAAVAEARAAWGAAWTDAVSAAAAYERVCEAASASATALDEARFALSQIEAVNPQEGEYEELVAYLSRARPASSWRTWRATWPPTPRTWNSTRPSWRLPRSALRPSRGFCAAGARAWRTCSPGGTRRRSLWPPSMTPTACAARPASALTPPRRRSPSPRTPCTSPVPPPRRPSPQL